MKIKSKLLATAAVAAMTLMGAAAHAATTLGVDFSPSAVPYEGGSSNTWTLGYAFKDVSAAKVVGLGAWDQGLSGDVSVGLWDSTGNLLASTTVNSAMTPVGSAPWVFNAINPVALPVGQTYFVGSYGQQYYAYGVPATVAPQIAYVHDAWTGGGLSFPSQSSGSYVDAGFLGGNVQLAPVPEPTTWALMGLGLAATGGMLRRRRRGVSAGAAVAAA